MDGDNEITAENIKDAMAKIGRDISDDEIAEIMRRHDISGDKKLSFDEFKKMILEDNIWVGIHIRDI